MKKYISLKTTEVKKAQLAYKLLCRWMDRLRDREWHKIAQSLEK